MLRRTAIVLLLAVVALPAAARVMPDNRPYRCEIGLQGGLGYYVGDATSHIFSNVRETYGGHFRYRFDPRWSLVAKGLQHTIRVPETRVLVDKGIYKTLPARTRHMGNIDVTAEFNFFRIGQYQYDRRYKPFSPYIFLGIGTTVYRRYDGGVKAAAYLPFGIGFKYMFAPRWGIFWAWQHNLVFADDIEGYPELGDTYQMNGSNFMNCDLTSQMTIGLVFAFARTPKICKTCNW